MSDSEITVTVQDDPKTATKFTTVAFGQDKLVLSGNFADEFIKFCNGANTDAERWKLCEEFYNSTPDFHVKEISA